MPFIQRNADGEIVGAFANRQPGYAEEWLSDDSPELTLVSPEQAAADERFWRDSELAQIGWLRDRHRDQLEISYPTTLTPAQFTDLLSYMQDLRDWPQSEVFPDAAERPVPPNFITDTGINQ